MCLIPTPPKWRSITASIASVSRSGRRQACAAISRWSAAEKAPGQLLMKHQVTVEIEGEDKPALTAEWLGLIFI
jgi:hypothetical protein